MTFVSCRVDVENTGAAAAAADVDDDDVTASVTPGDCGAQLSPSR